MRLHPSPTPPSSALVCLIGLAAVLPPAPPVTAQDLGLGLTRNLDLPAESDAARGGDHEDPPEVVAFYDQTLEGDWFFYAVDRSTSMQESGELGRAKQEISQNISEFSPRTQFGVVFFDAGIERYPASGHPVEADSGSKSGALGWIAGVPGGEGSCMASGLREALHFAQRSSARKKVIVYVGDGGGTCIGSNERQFLERMVDEITNANSERAQINCVGVMMGGGRSLQEQFMRDLCGRNGGTYSSIN